MGKRVDFAHYVSIERLQPSDVVGDYDDDEESWTQVGWAYASIRAMGGRELIAARELHPEATYKVEMRYQPDIDPHMRLDRNGRKLDIVSVSDPDEMRRKLVLLCKAPE